MTRGLINEVASPKQSKNHVFQGLLASGSVDAYLRSKCTNPDIYTCDGAGLVVIRSLRTALCLSKKKTNNLRGRRFQFTTLETSVNFAKGISMLRTIA